MYGREFGYKIHLSFHRTVCEHNRIEAAFSRMNVRGNSHRMCFAFKSGIKKKPARSRENYYFLKRCVMPERSSKCRREMVKLSFYCMFT